MKKQNKGITLIALVITIIVLLILAGVALSVVFNGGLIEKSQKATEKVKMDSFKEEVTIAMIDRKIQPEGTLEESLNSSITGNKTVEASEYASDICYVTRNGDTVTVYENGDIVEGRVSVWTGGKTVPEIKQENGKFNWYIYTAEELKFLADYVNNGKNVTTDDLDLSSYLTARNYSTSDVVMTADTTVYLMNNIDLGAREGEGATVEARWETTVNEAKKWEPIGIANDDRVMVATFEGNNHTISGVYVNRTGKFNGIFGNSSNINNLTIKNSYIKGSNCTGGIVGSIRGTNTTVNNCHNINTIINGIGTSAGGVIGQLTSSNVASKCTNNGKIIVQDKYAGGVVGVGSTSTTITDCTNNGVITGYNKHTGGIVGYANTSCQISGCTNSGNVSGTQECTGGIVGYTATSCQISYCTNSGNVSTTSDYVGGIVGNTRESNQIRDCINSGNVSGTNDCVGGIAGYVCTSSQVSSCTNTGSTIGQGVDVAGIVAYLDGGIVIECDNTGNVEGNSTAGGIAGELNGTVDKCVNTGNIKSCDGVGGIVAHVSANFSATVTNCYNLGTVTLEKLEASANACGGIFGWVSNTSTSVVIKNNYNIGKVIGSDDVGGVIGHVTSTALGKFDISNNYSLKGCVDLKDINNPETVIPDTELTVFENEVMEADDMKTDVFVTTLGSDVWKRDASINNGYPILK